MESALIKNLEFKLSEVRNELKKIRQMFYRFKAHHEKDMAKLCKFQENVGYIQKEEIKPGDKVNPEIKAMLQWEPIGHIYSTFKSKNGTPRQGNIAPSSRGKLVLNKEMFTNPEHLLIGLQEYSHIWIIYHFHLNENKRLLAKVSPPRLDGKRIGVLSTRSPHRPNPIGLTLAKIEEIKGYGILLSGLDVIDATPVFDIKPYIPDYDIPITDYNMLLQVEKEKLCEPLSHFTVPNNVCSEDMQEAKVPSWIKTPPLPKLNVVFNPIAESQCSQFSQNALPPYKLQHTKNAQDLKHIITDILLADPRSVYRRHNCKDRLYYFNIDVAHITAWFDNDSVEVLRIEPYFVT